MMNEKQNILLTGASGTVGFDVLKQLLQRNNEFNITIFDVKTDKTIQLFKNFKNNIEIIYGDISNNEDVRKVCFNKDFVIHLAAIIPPLADELPKLANKVNVLGTENLIKNLEELSPKVFFMYSSSISVYGDRLENPYININDPLIPSFCDEYAETKIEAEKIITQSKLNWTIFRLSAIMGNHKVSKLMFHMPLDTSMEIATPKDTASAFVNGLNNKELISKKIFNLGGGSAYRTTYREFLIRSFKIMGLGKLNFPKNAFAEKNFHCGYYQDGDVLDEILHFRSGTIEDFYNSMNISTNNIKKKITSIFKILIKLILLIKSEPYYAFRTNNFEMKTRFFKS